jgi:hypothetical protein
MRLGWDGSGILCAKKNAGAEKKDFRTKKIQELFQDQE